MADIAPELTAAVENAYRVFGRYRLERPIDLCDQCYPAPQGIFAKRPLREIDAGLLSQYVDATLLSMGEQLIAALIRNRAARDPG